MKMTTATSFGTTTSSRNWRSFQQDAVRQAAQIIRDSAGAFVADVVGLGQELHRRRHRQAL